VEQVELAGTADLVAPEEPRTVPDRRELFREAVVAAVAVGQTAGLQVQPESVQEGK
jgi:hypothetical protein